MILKQTVTQKILAGENDLALDLAKELGFTQAWVRSLALRNKNNGPLTLVSALTVIRTKTLLQDSEILEDAIEAVQK